MVHTRAHADDRASLPRPGPRRSRALRERRRLDAAARRRRAPTARASPTSTGACSSTSPAGSAARTRATASRRSSRRSTQQVDHYLHQCFMVGVYEPYVDICRLLAELSPCAGDEQKSILVNSGAEAIENAVKIARAATGRPAVVVFDNAFHGRTLLTMTMTSKVQPVQGRLRPVRARGLPRAGAVPVPRRHDRRRDRGAEAALQGRGRPGRPSPASCSSPSRARAASSPMPPDFPRAPARALPRARDPLRRRRGAVRRRADREDVGDRALRGRRARPARLGQVDRRRAAARGGHRARRVDGRRSRGRARRHVRRQPALVRRGRRRARRGRRRRSSSRSATRARRDAARRGSTRSRRGTMRSATCAGSARCSRSSSPSSTPDRREGDRRRGVRARPAAALVRPLRQRDPAARPADDRARTSWRRASRCWRSRLRGRRWQTAADIDVRIVGAAEELRRRRRRRRRRPRDRARRVLHDARPVRLGQDDDAADDRRLRAARRGHDRARRDGRLPRCRRSTATSTPSSRTTRSSRT